MEQQKWCNVFNKQCSADESNMLHLLVIINHVLWIDVRDCRLLTVKISSYPQRRMLIISHKPSRLELWDCETTDLICMISEHVTCSVVEKKYTNLRHRDNILSDWWSSWLSGNVYSWVGSQWKESLFLIYKDKLHYSKWAGILGYLCTHILISLTHFV